MIPDIETIIECLIAGECTKEEAQRWIGMHMATAERFSFRQGYNAGAARHYNA